MTRRVRLMVAISAIIGMKVTIMRHIELMATIRFNHAEVAA